MIQFKGRRRIGIVGCGAVAELFYLPAFVKNRSLSSRLILVDINYERVKAVASKFGIGSYTQDYHDIFSDVDGAIVALPHHLHYEVAMAFLSNGVHVLCEKPLAQNFEEARSMIQEAERKKVWLCVNYTRRLFPSSKKIKELLNDGAIGQPIRVRVEEGGEFNWPTTSGFYFNWKISNHGVLMDRGPHVIDLICWWFDSRPKVMSYMDDSFGGCEAVAESSLLIGGSIPASVKLSWLSRLRNTFIIQGEKGTIISEVHNWREVILIKNDGSSIKIHPPTSQRYFSDFGVEVVNNFVGVIEGRDLPLITAQDVLDSVAIIDECYLNRKRFTMPWMEVK